MEFLTTKEEAQGYELFTDANAWTPERFWNYSLVKKEDSMPLKYYERSTFWVKLDIEKELEKHGKIRLKFLKHKYEKIIIIRSNFTIVHKLY